MKKAMMIVSILVVAIVSTACINNIAVQELNNKANEYMEKGDYEAAMSRLQASLDLDSTMYQTYYNYGIAAINAKKFDKAIEGLEDGIKIKPDFADFYYSLGVAQISLADELMESDDEKDNVKDEETLQKEDKEDKEDAAENKQKAIELKTAAIENLKTYLEKCSEPQDKDTVEEMIKQSEEFITENNKDDSKE